MAMHMPVTGVIMAAARVPAAMSDVGQPGQRVERFPQPAAQKEREQLDGGGKLSKSGEHIPCSGNDHERFHFD